MNTELKNLLKKLRNELLKNIFYTILVAGAISFILLFILSALRSLNVITKNNFPEGLLYVPIVIAIIWIAILIRNYFSMRKQTIMKPNIKRGYK